MITLRWLTGFFIIFLLLIPGCATQKTLYIKQDEEVEIFPKSFKSVSPDMNYSLFPSYLVQPGDVLEVMYEAKTLSETALDSSLSTTAGVQTKNVKKFEINVGHTLSVKFVHVPALNETQRVRPDGKISLPYIGEYSVIGKSVGEIERELRRLYARELKDPKIYVVVPDTKDSPLDVSQRNRELIVRPDGYISLPKIGEIKVAQKTVAAVNRELHERAARILSGISVDLSLKKSAGSMIYITGEVKKPGAYTISRPINILQALSLAGSYLPGASLDSVLVVRQHGERMVATRLNAGSLASSSGRHEMFFLQPDDTVLVPKSSLKQAAEVAAFLKEFLIFRGWGLNLDVVDLTNNDN